MDLKRDWELFKECFLQGYDVVIFLGLLAGALIQFYLQRINATIIESVEFYIAFALVSFVLYFLVVLYKN